MPRTEKQNEKIRNRRQSKIIAKSLYLFATKGFKAVSIDDIAKDVQCTHSLIYHYFPSKEELYRAVMIKVKENLKGLVDTSVVDGVNSPKEIIETILGGILEALKSSKRIEIACSLILILNLVDLEDEFAKSIMPLHKRPWELFNKIIQDGQAKGEFLDGDSKEYTVIIMSLIRGVSQATLNLKKEKFITPHVEMIMRTLVKE